MGRESICDLLAQGLLDFAIDCSDGRIITFEFHFHPLSEITKGQIAGRVRKVFGKGDEIIADHRCGSIFGRIVGHGIERVKYDLVLIVPRVGQLTKLNRGRLS